MLGRQSCKKFERLLLPPYKRVASFCNGIRFLLALGGFILCIFAQMIETCSLASDMGHHVFRVLTSRSDGNLAKTP